MGEIIFSGLTILIYSSSVTKPCLIASSFNVVPFLWADLAIIDKRRDAPGVSNAMNVIGSVDGKKCIIVDDLVDSGGTICNAAKALKENGATEVYGYCSHGVYSGKALDNINNSVLEEMVCTNTITPTFEVPSLMRYLSVAPLFGEAIKRINNETSISSLFD